MYIFIEILITRPSATCYTLLFETTIIELKNMIIIIILIIVMLRDQPPVDEKNVQNILLFSHISSSISE